MEILLPLNWRRVVSLLDKISVGLSPDSVNKISPERNVAVGGSSLKTDNAVTDFPEPDSPTMAVISPLLTLKLMALSASKLPSSVLNLTERFRTLNKGIDVKTADV
jgi:hypothetical protein